uniref:uncharacterized protein LOC120337925 n=1 Tax=Styela clava TaxID=7725 RepID=UPI00193A96A0|nr:uncharacterized protein LOC120337925 [Styela clava]
MKLLFLVVFGLAMDILSAVRGSILCSEVTDIIILIESRKSADHAPHQNDRRTPFKRHKDTALSVIHRLPMDRGNVRVTVAQFNSKQSKIEVIFDKPKNSQTQGSTIRKQKKSEVLLKIDKMIPLETGETHQGGNILGAFELVSHVIIPKILGNDKIGDNPRNLKTKIILVTIVSSYWEKPNINKLATVFVRLSKQGVLSYIAAYEMKDRPSQSVLPLIVSKQQFLMLPKFYQIDAVAGHLADAFQVCWKDGPCWPYNPCLFGCDCVENSKMSNGYKCISQSPYWLDKECTKPSAMLTCLPDRMELRLPKHYVTESKTHSKETLVYMGLSDMILRDECVARVVDDPSKDKGISSQSDAILTKEGFYYLISSGIMDNKCSSVLFTDEEKKEISFTNTVFKTRSFLPRGVRMDVPVVNVKCIYSASASQTHSLIFQSPQGRSARNDANGTFLTQNDDAFTPREILSKTILLNGHEFNYEKWRQKNPLQDPDEFFNAIQEHGGIENIIENVKLGKYTFVDQDKEKHKDKTDNEVIKTGVYDSLKLVGPDGHEGGIIGRAFDVPRFRARNLIAYQPPPGCHGGPYESGDMCNPIYHTKAAPTIQAETILATTEEEATTGATTSIHTTKEQITTSQIATLDKETTLKSTTSEPPTIYFTITVGRTTDQPTTTELTTSFESTTNQPSITESAPVDPTTTQPITTLTTSQKQWTTAFGQTMSHGFTVRQTSPQPVSTTLLRTTESGVTTTEATTVYNSVIRMQLFEDKALTREIGPGGAKVGSKVFVHVGPGKNAQATPGVCPYVRTCWMNVGDTVSNGHNRTDTNLMLVEDGCPVNKNPAGLEISSNGRSPNSVFSFQSLKYNSVPDGIGYYIQCNVTICDCSLTGCGKDCG